MINKPSNNDFRPRRRCFGDAALIFGLMKTPVLALLIVNFPRGVYMLMGQWLAFNHAMLSYSMTCIFRYRYGVNNIGIGLAASTIGLIAVYNSIHVQWKALSAFVWVSIPALPFFYEWQTLFQWVTVDLHSPYLLYWGAGIAGFSIIHIAVAYLSGGHSDVTKRGESWLLTLLRMILGRTKLKVSEFFVCCFMECGIVFGIGYYFWVYESDMYMAAYCALVASSEVIQQLRTKTSELHRRVILEA